MNSGVDGHDPGGDLPIRVVLVETSHPGNIGAAARAMKTMSLSRLWLVNPSGFPGAEASARAAGATDVLDRARVCGTLSEALAGSRFVVGTSARKRALPWPLLTARDCGERLVAEARSGEVAVVFGREQSGLTNEELKLCHAAVRIPTSPDFSSLNLAMAVQVICYEILVASGGGQGLPEPRDTPLAAAEEVGHFFDHLERVLVASGFLNPANPRHLMLRLHRLFARAEPDSNEVAILRGILSALAPGSGRAVTSKDDTKAQ